MFGWSEAQAAQDCGRTRGGRIGADVGEPGADLGDAAGLARKLGLRQQLGPLGIGRQHGLEQALRAAGSLLRQPPQAGSSRELDAAGFGDKLTSKRVEERGLAGPVAATSPTRAADGI